MLYWPTCAAIRYWPAEVGGEDVLLLGPIAVHPTRQSEGLGGLLINESLAEARRLGWERVLLVGDAPYYSRFGFRKLHGVEMPPPTNPDRILGLELKKGAWANVQSIRPGRLLPLQPPNMEQIGQEIAMSRNWVFAANNQSEKVLDAEIADEAAFFKEAMKLMGEYPDDDPARQGLEFVRVYMRTALQAAAREAHKLFTNATSGGADAAGGAAGAGAGFAVHARYGRAGRGRLCGRRIL